MGAYIGYKPIGVEFFWSQRKPTRKSHPKYIMCTGPFKNKTKAEEKYRAGWR